MKRLKMKYSNIDTSRNNGRDALTITTQRHRVPLTRLYRHQRSVGEPHRSLVPATSAGRRARWWAWRRPGRSNSSAGTALRPAGRSKTKIFFRDRSGGTVEENGRASTRGYGQRFTRAGEKIDWARSWFTEIGIESLNVVRIFAWKPKLGSRTRRRIQTRQKWRS